MNENIEKINKKEFAKQYREEIVKSGEYFKAEIVVPNIEAHNLNCVVAHVECMPSVSLEHRCNAITLYTAVKTLKGIIDKLYEENPELKIIEKMVSSETCERIECGGDDVE